MFEVSGLEFRVWGLGGRRGIGESIHSIYVKRLMFFISTCGLSLKYGDDARRQGTSDLSDSLQFRDSVWETAPGIVASSRH